MATKFAFELAYDNTTPKLTPGSYGNAQYNGNIAGMLWRSYGDKENRKYNFTYDPANRLLKADFTQFSGSAYDVSAGLDFSTKMGNGINPTDAYDANGNIVAMEQKGWKGASSPVIDQLSYSYLNNGNQLASVTDTAAATSTLGDFNDGNKAGNDYSYDVNGNLIQDKNKGISTILYNHLNLPYEIRIPGKGKILYTYDNLGRKWKKQVVDSTGSTPKTTTWLYMGNFVYKNDTIQFYTHEEGRARYDTTQTGGEANKYHWDYFLRDHLGNTRMVLTEQKDTIPYVTLTFENEHFDLQQAIWENAAGGSIVLINRNSRPTNFGTAGSNGSYAKLIAKSTGPIGAAKLLKVMAGDRIHTQIDYFYWTTNTDNSGANGIGSLLTSFATSLVASAQVSPALKSGASTLASALSSNSDLVSLLNTPNATSGSNNAPKAYLNILFFDEQLKFDKDASQVVPVSYLVNSRGTLSRMMANAVEAKKNGYVYVYFSNESETLVYFDNFMLTHELGPLREETHYYPFGLTMAGISSQALGKMDNRIKFQGQEFATKEFSDGSGLNMYEFKWRMHDPQIGRFWQVDPLSEKYVHNSTYAFSENKVIVHRELEGLEAEYVFKKAKEELAGAVQGLANIVDKTVSLFTKSSTSTETSSTPVSTTSVGSTVTTNTSTNLGGNIGYILHNNTSEGNNESFTKTTTDITIDTKTESKTPGVTLTNKTTLSTGGVVTNEVGAKARVIIEGVPATISGGAAVSTNGQTTATIQGTTSIPGSVGQGTAQVQYSTNGTTQSASFGVGGQVTTGKTTTSTIFGIKFSWDKK